MNLAFLKKQIPYMLVIRVLKEEKVSSFIWLHAYKTPTSKVETHLVKYVQG